MQDDLTTLDAGEPARSRQPPRAYLAVLEGAAPAVTALPEGHPLSLGRSRSSGLPIDDGAVSRLHATLVWRGGATASITDHGSRNGTTLNGERIEGTVEASDGAELGLGSARLLLVIRAAAGRGRTAEERLVACSPAMLRVVALAERAARADATVLLVGETGVGKEVLARRVHELSARSRGPFVAVNCGAITETLAESALFGHERGAFTGATERHVGFFEQAHRGTLLLDEVGELSPAMQVRLLRVLQEREVVRLGSAKARRVDVRLVAATNAALDERARAGSFREDLLYRLDVMRIEIPPLRERPDDVAPLVERFLEELGQGSAVRLSAAALDLLRAHRWPGNARELRNVVERSVAVRERDLLGPADIVGLDSGAASPKGTLRSRIGDLEREEIVAALEAAGGNQSRAARRLGISRRALIYKMERLGLKAPPERAG